jgi:hypothetical protein
MVYYEQANVFEGARPAGEGLDPCFPIMIDANVDPTADER